MRDSLGICRKHFKVRPKLTRECRKSLPGDSNTWSAAKLFLQVWPITFGQFGDLGNVKWCCKDATVGFHTSLWNKFKELFRTENSSLGVELSFHFNEVPWTRSTDKFETHCIRKEAVLKASLSELMSFLERW